MNGGRVCYTRRGRYNGVCDINERENNIRGNMNEANVTTSVSARAEHVTLRLARVISISPIVTGSQGDVLAELTVEIASKYLTV